MNIEFDDGIFEEFKNDPAYMEMMKLQGAPGGDEAMLAMLEKEVDDDDDFNALNDDELIKSLLPEHMPKSPKSQAKQLKGQILSLKN